MEDEWDEYGTYEMEDDFYQMNQNEADDYRNEDLPELDGEYCEEQLEIYDGGEW